ncbi:MAG: polysaccharide deacetylase family protein [Chloroflexota bacterium]
MRSLTRRDFLKLGGAALLAASLPNMDFAQTDSLPPAPWLWRGSAGRHSIALTYDDCYSYDRMQIVEALLDEFPEFKVTFFPVGMAILNLQTKDRDIWKRLHEKGHEFGYHSWDHEDFATMSTQEVLDDYSFWREAMSNALGFQPTIRFARPTFGNFAYSFDALCRKHGLVYTMWSTGWGGPTDIGLRAAWNSRNGDVVLMHIRKEDCETSRQAYPWLRENGWGVVTLSKLYDDLLLEQNNSEGCDVDGVGSLTRTCLE